MGAARKIIFETPRLTIRNFAESDWQALQAFGGRPEVARMMASLKSPWLKADVLDWMTSAPYRGQLGFRAGIFLKDGPLIGFVGLGGEPPDCAYAIDPAHWGKGYASEALAGLLAHCFSHFDVDLVTAAHFCDNPASGQVLTKLGFQQTGIGMGESAARLEPAPNITYRLTRSQYEATLR
ncbi:MAG: hypothetical protein CSA68_07865 [Rhodobacterales bacterium]|nr:MAG: hypothetical protein CSA68_07865 [Rhodobacterales bacterium]